MQENSWELKKKKKRSKKEKQKQKHANIFETHYKNKFDVKFFNNFHKPQQYLMYSLS